MKKIYLLLLFFANMVAIQAQRKVDLSIDPTRVHPGDTIQLYQLFRFDGNTPYRFSFSVSFSGPDSLVVGDTIVLNTSWSKTDFYFPINTTYKGGGFIVNIDTGQGYRLNGAGDVIFLPKPGASFGQLDTVTWYNITRLISAPGNPVIDPDQNNNYRFLPPVITQSMPLGVQNVQSLLELQLYPNPCYDNLHCIFKLNKTENIRIVLRDIFGRQVKQFSSVVLSGKQEYNVNVSDLPRGLYFAELHTDEGATTKQIILQ